MVPLVRRAGNLFVPPIALDRCSSTPLHQQVGRQIACAIRTGVPAGLRLPSSRVMARLLGVSRNTVMAAYDDLVAEGLIQGRRGAGMLVTSIGFAGVGAVNVRRLMRQAQFPSRTLRVVDPDGTDVYLSFR